MVNLYNPLIHKHQRVVCKATCSYISAVGYTNHYFRSMVNLYNPLVHKHHRVVCKATWRLNAEYFHCIEKSMCYGDHIRAGTQRVTTIIEARTGLHLNQVCGILGKGGGSTDGNSGKVLFSLKGLDDILMCMPEKYRDDLSLLHKYLSVNLENYI